jgi:integrase
LLTARLITVLPQLRSAAFRGDDEATVMISNVKRWLKSLIGAAGALEAPLQMEGGVHTAVPAANDGRLPMEAVGAVVAEVMKALGSATAAAAGPGRPAPSPATPLLPRADSDESVDRWIQLHAGTWTPKTTLEFRRIARQFTAWLRKNGRHALADVQHHDVTLYKLWLMHERSTPLSHKTVNKHIAALNTLFVAAQQVGHYPSGTLPTARQLFKKKTVRKVSKSWLPLTDADLALVFEPEAYRQWARQPDQYWVPLLMLHHGPRLGEACQLTTHDFVTVDGVHCVRIDDHFDGTAIKTESSRRIIPLHPGVLQLGLLDYIADVRNVAGDGLIFPYLRTGSLNGFGDATGESINKYMERRLCNPRKRSHSFRHTVVETLKQAGVHEEWRCEFVGHSHDTVDSTTYSSPLIVRKMQELVLPSLRFPLDYEALKYRCHEFDQVIHRRIERRRHHQAHKDALSRRGND